MALLFRIEGTSNQVINRLTTAVLLKQNGCRSKTLPRMHSPASQLEISAPNGSHETDVMRGKWTRLRFDRPLEFISILHQCGSAARRIRDIFSLSRSDASISSLHFGSTASTPTHISHLLLIPAPWTKWNQKTQIFWRLSSERWIWITQVHSPTLT